MRVRLYTQADCHLCREAAALLERLLSPARRGGDGLNGHDHP